METAVNISKLFIPVIALIGIYIAWHQYYANREKIKLELYEKRFVIYDSILRYVDELLRGWEEVSLNHRTSFETACNEADFLLPERVCKEIASVRESVRALQKAKRKLDYINRKGEGGTKADDVNSEIEELENRLERLMPTLREAFMKVLKFEKI